MSKKLLSLFAIVIFMLSCMAAIPSLAATHVHSYSITVANVNATCTRSGYLLLRCSRCSGTRRINKSILSHSYSSPTCTSGQKCTRCGKTGSIGALGHNYKPATCTTPERCTRCNATRGNGLGHSYTKFVSCSKPYACIRCGVAGNGNIAGHKLSNPTCTTNAKCTRCTFEVSGSKLGHLVSSYTETKKPTCLNTGTKSGTCTRSGCSQIQTVSVPATGHNYTRKYCTEDLKCTKCNHVAVGSKEFMHTKYVKTAATCIKTGQERCSFAGCQYSRTLPITSHNYQPSNKNIAYSPLKCVICGACGEKSIEDSMLSVNPNHSYDSCTGINCRKSDPSLYTYCEVCQYRVNCQRCALAYEMNRRGYNFEAGPNPSVGDTFDPLAIWLKHDPIISCSGNGYDDVVEYINNADSTNARFHIVFTQKGDDYTYEKDGQIITTAGKHIFVAEKMGDEIVFLDPQTGRIMNQFIAYELYFRGAEDGYTQILRVDNAQLDPDYLDYIINLSENN